jgi:hypothetical protein
VLGVLASGIAVATVTGLGRRVPDAGCRVTRTVMLLVLAGMLLAVGAGATIMIVDGFVGLGVSWRWHQVATRRVAVEQTGERRHG